MHRALWTREILLDIFGYCRPSEGWKAPADLAVLARTCRVFQDPALDVLWAELPDPFPLVRCVPEACCRTDRFYTDYTESYSRSLSQSEWHILQGYTRRVRSISRDPDNRFDWESFITFIPPAIEPLFPNLHRLTCDPAMLAIDMDFPSLTSLSIHVDGEEDLRMLRYSLKSFSKFSSNLREFKISMPPPGFGVMLGDILSGCISQWQNLRAVGCYHIAFDLDALVHLSHLPALARLVYTMHPVFLVQLTFSAPSLVFPTLRHLGLYDESPYTISQLLSRTRLPVMSSLHAYIQRRPAKPEVSSFFHSVQTSGCSHSIQDLRLFQETFLGLVDMVVEENSGPEPILGLEDMRSCMTFSNLQRINLNVKWKIELTNNELLTLASAWRHLEFISINSWWGWNSEGGITPNGLLQLLNTCPLLNNITLAVDTRGYTHHTQSPASLGLTLPPTLFIDILDSMIEEEAVPAVAAFFASIGSCSTLSLFAGNWLISRRSAESASNNARWKNVGERLKEAVDQCS